MTPYDAVKAQLSTSVPFANHVGVELLEIGDGVATARLDQRQETSNHIGSQHAGAMFTLGEAASGAAMAGGFVSVILNVRPVAAVASIRYVKVAKGTLEAEAKVAGDVAALLGELEPNGKVQFAVDVVIRDGEGDPVVEMQVEWYLSHRR